MRKELNKPEKLFLKSQKVFNEEIDITNLLKRIKEIEKLKYLLINHKQLVLFNFLGKTIITEDEKNVDESIYYKENKTTEKLIEEAYEYYKNLKK